MAQVRELFVLHEGGANIQQTTAITLVGAVLWFALAIVIKNLPKFRSKSTEHQSRVISIIHAVIQTAFSLYACNFGRPMDEPIGSPSKPIEMYCLLVSVSYFLYDTVASFIWDYWEHHFAFHHGAVSAGMLWGVLGGSSGYELCACTFLFEVSNPPMHYRWLLLDDKAPRDFTFRVTSWLFAGSFIFARLVIGVPLLYFVLVNPRPVLMIKSLAVTMLIMVLYFCYLIFTVSEEEEAKSVEKRKTKGR